MKKTFEVEYCTELLIVSGSRERLRLLKLSNLNLRERKIVSMRFITGLSAKEVAAKLGTTEQNLSKTLNKIFQKMYLWLKINGENKALPQAVIEYFAKQENSNN